MISFNFFFQRLYFLLNLFSFLGCYYCSYLKIPTSDSISSFVPRNITHYSFSESPTDVYIAWAPPLNYLHSNPPDLSGNNANARNKGDPGLKRLSIPLHQASKSQLNQHPQYNLVSNNPHGSSNNGSYQSEMNSTKNLTRIGHNAKESSTGSAPYTTGITYDVFGFVEGYTVFYKQQQEPDEKFSKIDTSQTWVMISNLTLDKTYEIYIKVLYSSKRQINSPRDNVTIIANSSSVCKCNLIGSKLNESICNLTNGKPCNCNPGYGGLFCDQCQSKHYKKNEECLPCPCESKLGSFNCRIVNNAPICNCHLGYSGDKCQHCSNGFFSYYGTCAKCICHNNVDPKSPEICDPDIGACKHCLYNTTGFACSECLPGYLGDPILHKNCTKASHLDPKQSLPHSTKSSSPRSLIVGLPLVVLFLCIIIGVLVVQRHRFYKKLQPFWTIELKDDHDSVNFTANDGQEFGSPSPRDLGASNMDDMDFYEKHQRGMQYSPLRETM